MLNPEPEKKSVQQSEAHYRKMIEEVEDYAILMLNTDGIIQNWNAGAQKIKGYTAEEAVGKNFSIFYTPEDKKTGLPQRLLREAYENGRAIHQGWRLKKDGSVFWGSIVITALHNDLGEVIGYTKVTRDLTDMKKAEDRLKEYAEELRQKNLQLEEFTYVASHDLKEPLRKIVSFGDLIQHSGKDAVDARTLTYIQRMQDAARRMMSLIEDILQFSHLGRNMQPFEQTDLNNVVEGVVQDLEPLIQERNASVIAHDLPVIMALPLQMQQLFQNLVSNALKFNNKENPVVNITSTPVLSDNEPVAYRIAVADNGIGFDEAYRERIFEVFHRLHGRSEYPGSGIGLAICKKVVDLHKGTISAAGEKDKGATFIVELPRQQA